MEGQERRKRGKRKICRHWGKGEKNKRGKRKGKTEKKKKRI